MANARRARRPLKATRGAKQKKTRRRPLIVRKQVVSRKRGGARVAPAVPTRRNPKSRGQVEGSPKESASLRIRKGPEGKKKLTAIRHGVQSQGGRSLVSLGRKKGYLTYEEINSLLPDEVTSAAQIVNPLNIFDEMDIEVVDGV